MDLVLWWMLLAVLGAGMAPMLPRLFPDFPDRGAALARPLAIVWVGLVAWIAGSLGLAYEPALALGVVSLVATSIAARPGAGDLPPVKEIVVGEIGFAAAFAFFAFLRSLRPEIFGAEKYMDFAFFNAILRTDAIPPEDPWLSGRPIHYYYFGYLLFANLARLSGIAPEVAYNLALATIGAIVFVAAASIGHATSRSRLLGLVGGAGAILLGNLDGARQLLLEGVSIGGLDYWRSSRVVPNTITEFPFFSILHGDLHPHVTGLVALVPFVGVLLGSTRAAAEGALSRLELARLGAAAGLLTAIALANPWDAPLAFVLFLAIAVWRGADPAAPLRSATAIALTGAAVLAVVFLATLPFRLHFVAPLSGVGRVHAQTSLQDAFVVFGPFAIPAVVVVAKLGVALLPEPRELRHLLIAVLAGSGVVIAVAGRSPVLAIATLVAAGAVSLLLDRERSGELGPATALLGLGAAAVGACEVVFLRDPYGADLHRMNTVFKFYFQAWIYFALAWPAVLATLGRLGTPRWIGLPLLAAALGAGLCYPAGAVATFGRTAPRPLGLDGLRHLERSAPGDATAIDWLRANAEPGAVVLEAVGGAYSAAARISANTGIPTLLGWENHERLWRGNAPIVGIRDALVREIYDGGDAEAAHAALVRERVRFVVVGRLERSTYSAAGLDKFAARDDLFPVALASGDITVFAVAGSSARTSASAPASTTTARSGPRSAIPSGNTSARSGWAVPTNVPARS